MYNELFSIGPITIYGYGLMIAIGIIAAYLNTEYLAQKHGLDPEPVFNILLIGVGFGILGAKLLFYITILDQIIANPQLILNNLTEGFVVYGGIIFGILSAFLYCKKKELAFLHYLDCAAPSIALAQGFGRIGCLLAGCCYGRETDAWYGMEFNHSVYYNMIGVKVIPTQLIMSAANFVHFFLLAFIANKVYKTGKDGVIAGCYLLFYSIGRFLIEFLRNDPRGGVGVLSTSQFISLFIFAAGAGMVLFFGLRKGETSKEQEITK